jgi:hypothetical protein
VVRGGGDGADSDRDAWLERYRELRYQHYRPGTLTGDFNRFLDALDGFPVQGLLGGWQSLDPWRAAAALVQHDRFLSSGFKDPWVARCLGRLVSRHSPDRVECLLRTEIFPEALMLAATDITRRRRVRLAEKPVKDAAGRFGAFSPEHLALVPDFYTWLRQEAHRMAEELVADWADDPKPDDESASAYGDPLGIGRALDDFLAEAEDLEHHLMPEPVAKRPLRPHDELVQAMTADGHTAAEIGQVLDRKPGAVRVRRYRIRHRL